MSLSKEVLELRTKGKSFSQIAFELGISRSAVSGYVWRSTHAGIYKSRKSHIVDLERRLVTFQEALHAIEPYLDAIICYASTIDEYAPNGIVLKVRAALASADADKTS